MQHRTSFIDFVSGLLNLNPLERWTPQQARQHPFITGEKFVKPFQLVLNERALQTAEAPAHPPRSSSLQESTQGSDGKRYGGLVPQPPKGTRPYTDAGEYGQRLAQHQAHIAQQQAQAATTSTLKNPYLTGGSVQQTTGTNGQSGYVYSPSQANSAGQLPPATQYASRPKDLSLDPYANQSPVQPQQPQQQARMQPLTSMVSSYNPSMSANVPTHQQPHPPSSSYYPNNRGRANTINQLDQVPPSLARAHLDLEAAGMGRNTLTPVINREDPVREWERRQAAGRAGAAGPAFPQLEYLQQQVEMDGSANRWAAMNQRYAPVQPSSLQFQSPPAAVVVDTQDRGATIRDAALSSARAAAGLTGTGSSSGRYDHPRNSANVPAPPQPAYSTASPMAPRYNNGGSNGGNSAYPPTQSQGQTQPPPASYDAFDQRDGIGTLYMPMQPNSYSNYPSTSAPPPNSSTPQGANSLYGSGVVASGGPPPTNAFMAPASAAQQQQAAFAKDGRRLSGMDVGWSR